MYPIVKQFHIWLMLISITLFQFRYWYYKVRQQPAPTLIRVLPHAIDTLLLASGVWLAWMLALNPLKVDWLGFKLAALLAYIMLGSLAMKKTSTTQWSSYLLATLAVLFMLWAATSKLTWPA